MVVIVAFLLAFVSKALKTKSDANVAIDKKSQILASLNIRGLNKDNVQKTYSRVVVADEIVTLDGTVIDKGTDKDKSAFTMSSKDITQNSLPLYVCKIDNKTKYVVPVYGMGLWGGLWGYISINEDGNTIYGAYFSHESETAGLGALITEKEFQEQFHNKIIYGTDGTVNLSVIKKGKAVDGLNDCSRCDAVTGATLTSNGVDAMLKNCLKNYVNILSNLVKE